jgi:hypothetical protein
LFLKNRLPKLRQVKFLDEKRIKSVLFFSGLSVLTAGVAWFLNAAWLSAAASLSCLMGISVFFNVMKEWFHKTQHFHLKKEDLLLIGFWLLWLLSGSLFLANILFIFLYTKF